MLNQYQSQDLKQNPNQGMVSSQTPPDPLAASVMANGYSNVQKQRASSLSSNYWANQGIDLNTPYFNKSLQDNVWAESNTEAIAREKSTRERYDSDYMKSMFGMTEETIRQVGSSMMGAMVDTVNIVAGSEGLEDFVYSLRMDAQSRMSAYADDRTRRNIINAASSVGQMFGWRGVGLAAGAAVSAVPIPGAQAVGGYIAAASLASVSLGFGLDTWSTHYHEGVRLGLTDEEASKRALAAGLVTGVSTYGLGKVLDTGLAAAGTRSTIQANANNATKYGIRRAFEITNKLTPENVKRKAVQFGKDYAGEMVQEHTELAGHIVNDMYWLDRDVSVSEIAMLSSDIAMTVLGSMGGTHAISGAVNYNNNAKLKKINEHVRTNEVITAANDTFNIIKGKTKDNQTGDSYADVVKYMYENNVDPAAVSSVLHQFISTADSQVFSENVVLPLQERITQRKAALEAVDLQIAKLSDDIRNSPYVAYTPETQEELTELEEDLRQARVKDLAFTSPTVIPLKEQMAAKDTKKQTEQVPDNVQKIRDILAEVEGVVEKASEKVEPTDEAVRIDKEQTPEQTEGSDVAQALQSLQTTPTTPAVEATPNVKPKTEPKVEAYSIEAVTNVERQIHKLEFAVDNYLGTGTTAIKNVLNALSNTKNQQERKIAIEGARKLIPKVMQRLDKAEHYKLETPIRDSIFDTLNIKPVATPKGITAPTEYEITGLELAEIQKNTKDIDKTKEKILTQVDEDIKSKFGYTQEITQSTEEVNDILRTDAEGNSDVGITTRQSISILSPISIKERTAIVDKVLPEFYTQVKVSKSKTTKGKATKSKFEYFYVPKGTGDLSNKVNKAIEVKVDKAIEDFNIKVGETLDGKEVTLDLIQSIGNTEINNYLNRSIGSEKIIEKSTVERKAREQRAKDGTETAEDLQAKEERTNFNRGLGKKLKNSGLVELIGLGKYLTKQIQEDGDLTALALLESGQMPGSKSAYETVGLAQKISEQIDSLPFETYVRENLKSSVLSEMQVAVEKKKLETKAPKEKKADVVEQQVEEVVEEPTNVMSEELMGRVIDLQFKSPEIGRLVPEFLDKGNIVDTILELEKNKANQELVAELRAINRSYVQEHALKLRGAEVLEVPNSIKLSLDTAHEKLTLMAKALSPEAQDTATLVHQSIDEIRQIQESSIVLSTINPSTHSILERILSNDQYQEYIDFINPKGPQSKHENGIGMRTTIGDTYLTGETNPTTGKVSTFPHSIAALAAKIRMSPKVLEFATVAHEEGHLRLPKLFKNPKSMSDYTAKLWADAQDIESISQLVDETFVLYSRDTQRVREGSSIESLMGEELLMRIGEKMVARNIEEHSNIERSEYGRAVDDPRIKSIWNRFKAIVRQGIIKSGAAKKLGLKFTESDIDVMAFKTMDNWLTAPDGLAKTKPGEVQRVGVGITYDSLVENGIQSKVLYHAGHKWQSEPDFPTGKPSLNLVGTGENNVTFGWGFYSAESKNVHNRYMEAAERYAPSLLRKGKPVELKDLTKAERFVADQLPGLFDKSSRIHPILLTRRVELSHLDAKTKTFILKNLDTLIENFEFRRLVPTSHKLNLQDSDEVRLFDWDTEMPAKQITQLQTEWNKTEPGKFPVKQGMTGEQAYESFTGWWSLDEGVNKKETSKFFNRADIIGTKYDDQFTREGRGDTKNYVLWNQEALDNAVTDRVQLNTLQSKILAPTIELIGKTYGVDEKLDSTLRTIAEKVLGISNAVGTEVTTGDFLTEVQSLMGRDLGILSTTMDTAEVAEYLHNTFTSVQQELAESTSSAMKDKQIKKISAMTNKMVKTIREKFPHLTQDEVVEAIYENYTPKGAVPIEDMYKYIHDKVFSKVETEIEAHMQQLVEMGISLNLDVADAVRTAYNEDWNNGRNGDSVPLHIMSKVQQVENLGTRTKESVLDDLDEVSDLLLRLEQGEEGLLGRKDLYTIQHALRLQLSKINNGVVSVPSNTVDRLKLTVSMLKSKLLQLTSIESSMREQAIPEHLIRAVKATGSVKGLMIESMTKPLDTVMTAIKNTGNNNTLVQNHAILLAEGTPAYLKIFKGLPKKLQQDITSVVPHITEFYAKAKEIMLTDYGSDIDFQKFKIIELEREVNTILKSMKGTSKKKRKNLKFKRGQERAKELYDRIALLKATGFVSISNQFITESKAKKKGEGRQTLTFFGLLEEKANEFKPGFTIPDIYTTDILTEYITTIANDVAMANIIKNAKNSPLITPKGKGDIPVGWVDGKNIDTRLNGKIIDETLGRFLVNEVQSLSTSSTERNFRFVLNVTKAKEFLNPFFMLSNDSIQGVMIGANPFGKNWTEAKADVVEIRQAYKDNVLNGGMARPNVNPRQELLRRRARLGMPFRPQGISTSEIYESQVTQMLLNVGAIKNVAEGNYMDGLKSLVKDNTITGMYSVSREYAWFYDQVLRQVGYNHLIKQGHTPETAGRFTARSYVDYSDMPRSTRRALTSVMFTPVYAFESMMGLARNTLETSKAIKTVSQGKATTVDMKLAVRSIISMGVMNGIVEAFMKMSGFDRDEERWWDNVLIGRKFKKEFTDKDGLKKMVRFRMGTALTVWQRELDRMAKISDVDNIWELPQSAYRAVSSLRHPIFRNIMNLVDLKDRRGEPVWDEFDSTSTKYIKASKVFATDWVPMLGWAMSSDNGIVSDEARSAALGNWDNMGGQLFNMLYFPYITDTDEKRRMNKARYYNNAYRKQIKKLYQENGTVDDRLLRGLRIRLDEQLDAL